MNSPSPTPTPTHPTPTPLALQLDAIRAVVADTERQSEDQFHALLQRVAYMDRGSKQTQQMLRRHAQEAINRKRLEGALVREREAIGTKLTVAEQRLQVRGLGWVWWGEVRWAGVGWAGLGWGLR